jgi:dolichol-phosphate mannosyltransferase
MTTLRPHAVVVPTYEEARNIDELVAGVRLHAPQADLVFVDDAGRDDTASRIEAHRGRGQTRVHLIRHPRRLGVGAALLAGLDFALRAGYVGIVQMDADLSHRPSDLPLLFDGLERHPVVAGSRYVRGGGVENWGLWRQAISRWAGIYSRAILGLDLSDPTSGFCGWRPEALERIGLSTLTSEGYLLEVELKHRAVLAGLGVHEVPIVFVERRAGESKLSGRAVLDSALGVWRLARAAGRVPGVRSRRRQVA